MRNIHEPIGGNEKEKYVFSDFTLKSAFTERKKRKKEGWKLRVILFHDSII